MTNVENIMPEEVFYYLSGTHDSPWELDRPQSVIIKLVEKGIFHGEVLDIGCGIGDNAIYIATHTNNVNMTAIDLVPKAIETARKKAEENKSNIQFEVVNILDDLSATKILKEHSYDIVLDSAVFHFFSNEDRLRYMKNLEYLIKHGGLYIQLCFSEKEIRKGGPRRMKKSDLDEIFSSTNGWQIESIEDTIYETRPESPLGVGGQAYLSFIRRNNTT